MLCLDAGNTVIFLDHARLAAEVSALGHPVSRERLVAAEGDAKLLAESGGLLDFAWPERDKPGAASWGRTVGTMLAVAGVPKDALPEVVSALWKSHVDLNFWSAVPEGLGEALEAFRATAGKVAIVSNSEGMLASLFTRLGIARHFDLVADSGLLGVEKPDPRIFQHVLTHFDAKADKALHLGDIFATDVLGARAAGIRHALIDPFGHYEGRHADVLRVPGVVSVAHALAQNRTTP